jgi:virginiamycin B lyase
VQEVAVGDEPYYLAVGEGAVWVPNRRDGTLMRVDPPTGAVIATIAIGDPARGCPCASNPLPGVAASAAVAGGSVWVAKEDERAVARVDPRTNAVAEVIPLGVPPHRLAAGTDALWVTSREGGAEDGVLRVDLATRQVVARIPTPVPGMLAVTEEAVWVGNVRGDSVTRIDPRTNTIAAVVPLGGPGPHPVCSLCTSALVAGHGAVWAGYTRGGVGSELARIDPATNTVVAVIAVAANPVGGAAGARGLWLAHFQSETVTHVDPATNAVVGASAVGSPLLGVALDGDTAWATSHPHDRLLRLELLP